jgi:hypothetical protein
LFTERCRSPRSFKIVRRRSLVRKLVLLVAAAVTSGMVVSALLAMGQEVERYANTRREFLRATAHTWTSIRPGANA